MSEKIVAGVDFSDAKTAPVDTWLAMGRLGNLGLEILEITKVGSHALARDLAGKGRIAALGIDCPFSMPIDFMKYLAMRGPRKDYENWQAMAQEVAFMSLEDFLLAVKEFKKEPKRLTDQLCVVPALSPLHRGSPSMAHMTYHGVRLLAMLDPKTFFVIPFQEPVAFAASVIEVYPRALLKTLGISATGYKSEEKKDQERMHAIRGNIVQSLVSLRERKGITYQKFPRLNLPKRCVNTATESDHALDALLACYATAVFQDDPSLFKDPLSTDNLDVLFEGWIYNPEI